MGRTSGDKCKLGKEWIDKLDLSYVCRTFHGQILVCNCICKLLHEEFVTIKEYFKNLVDVFWLEDYHLANRTKPEEIGTCLGHFLLPSCTLNSQRPEFQFKIGEKYYTFCLPTLTKMFGLNQKSCTFARNVLTNKHAIGLNLLKIATQVNIKNDQFEIIFGNFRDVFGHQVVPVSPCNPQSVTLVETKLKGLIIQLDDDAQIALEYINRNHCPLYKKLDPVSHGGENIRFGPPKGLEQWQSFDKHPAMKKLPEQIKESMKCLWGLQNKVFKYKPSFIFSELTAERDNIPQKAHMDYDPNVMKWERENLQCYSCIGITPLHPDGCMIVVWTEGIRKKFRTTEEIEFDEKRSKKKINPKPGQYFLYIPKGTMLILPGDTIHAGGFCFGSRLEYPSAKNIQFQNHRLHFFFCCSEEAVTNANGKKNTIIADNTRICYDDFKPDDTVMQDLFENLLDRHSNFVFPEKKKKTSKKTVMKKNMNRKRVAKKLLNSKKKKSKK